MIEAHDSPEAGHHADELVQGLFALLVYVGKMIWTPDGSR